MKVKTLCALQTNEESRVAIRFETARKIRELLDAARAAYPAPEDFDDGDVETTILSLVTDE